MREKLIELLDYLYCGDLGIDGCETCKYRYEDACIAHAFADYLIANGVTIPVRCKECKHSFLDDENRCCCDNPDGLLGVDRPDDFCSYGERRTDGN